MGDTEVNILLPICTELCSDIFLDIIQNIIAHSPIDTHYLANAVKSGMNGDKFSIASNDFKIDWKELTSINEQIRLSKMIGYWAIKNFPSLGQKFSGRKKYQAPQRKSVNVISNSEEIQEGVIDALIFSKMKLRVLKLNVGHSTVRKFNHFVNVPERINVYNECQITAQIKSFDIKNEQIKDCWAALKFGEFSVNENFVDQVGSFNTASRNVIDREQQQQSVIENDENISGSDELQINNPNYELHDGIEEIISDNESQIEPVAKQARTTVKEQYRPTSSSNHSQPRNLTKPLHILEPTVILEEQDTVISNRNECRSVSFENLLKEKEVLNAQLDRSLSLNDALQKGVDSCTKLYTMLETSSMKQIQGYILQLAKSESDTAKISEENATLRKELDNAKSIELLSQNKIVELLNCLAKVENDTAIIYEQNATLHQQINEAKSIELSSQSRIVELLNSSAKVEDDIAKFSDQNATHTTFRQELHEAKSIELASQNRIVELMDTLTKVENNAAKIYEDNVTLHRQLDDSKSKELSSQNRIVELLDSLAKFENDASKINEENGTLRQQLDNSKSTELLSQSRIEELLDSLTKAESEMSVFKNQANAMLSELHGQIEELTKCEAEHENLRQELDDSKSMELTSQSRIVELLDSLAKFENDASKINEENGTLRQQLDDSKTIELSSQSRIMELLDSLVKAESEMSVFKNQANAMLSELHGQIEELTKCEAEHENLRQELDDSKSMELTSQSRIVELLDSLAKFENDASKINEENGTLRQQLDDSKTIELSSQSRIMELLDSLAKAESEMSVFKNQANAMLSELHSQIEELKKCEAKPNEQSNNQECDIEKNESEVFITDDVIVQECRDKLLKLQFGWFKFGTHKKCKCYPGFAFPRYADGYCRAQKITPDGYVGNSRDVYMNFRENIEDNLKNAAEVESLKLFNEKFNTSFV